MKVALLTTVLEPGGAEGQILSLTKGLVGRGHEVHVAGLAGPGPLVEPLREAGATVDILGMARGRPSLQGLGALLGWLGEVRPQVLHTWLFHAGVAGRVAGCLRRAPPRVHSVQVAERGRRSQLLVDALGWPLVACYACASEAVSRWLGRWGVPSRRRVVIPNAVDLPAARGAPPDGGPGPPVVLCVARMVRQKGLDTLLRAVALLPRTRPVSLWLAGEGPERPGLERLARGLGLSRVEFLGWRADVPDLLGEADVLALPSRWEGLPVAVLEAMAAGVPVVATAVDGTAETVVHGETGLLVPPGDPVGLALALDRVLGDREAARRMGEAGRRRAGLHFRVDAMVEAYLGLYEGVLRTT
ncbi:MAG: glycosyltransferase [Planctomycetes bacterium]|nr:glycosyltransferase [Planctomycetota bacterium]